MENKKYTLNDLYRDLNIDGEEYAEFREMCYDDCVKIVLYRTKKIEKFVLNFFFCSVKEYLIILLFVKLQKNVKYF